MTTFPLLSTALVFLGASSAPVRAFALHMSSRDSPPVTTPESDGGGEPRKLVLVTGGSRGIGRAACRLLASRGYDVALNYCSNKDAALAETEVINEASGGGGGGGGRAVAFQANVAKEEDVARLFGEVSDVFGNDPDGLVCNAGIMEPMEKDICNVLRETLEADLATNTFGPFLCAKEFVRRASTNRGGKGGAVVVVSSVSADSGNPLAYSMSKAAGEAMVAGLSKTLPLEGIRINTVVPGLTDTDMASKDIIDAVKAFIPMRRAAEPMEVAETIAFLISDASSFCSGAKVRVSGGM